MVRCASIVSVVLVIFAGSSALAEQSKKSCGLCAAQLASIKADLDYRPEAGAQALNTALIGAQTGNLFPVGLNQSDAKAYFEILFHPEFLNRLVSQGPEAIARWDSAASELENLYTPTKRFARRD